MRTLAQTFRTFTARSTQRRAEREMFAHIAARPQNVRNELLEMASRTR